MPRAGKVQWVARVNQAFEGLKAGLSPPEVTQRLIAATAISLRQAYRYVEEAQRLNAPLASVDSKVVFTVKLPEGLVDRLHRYAESTGQTLSQIVSQALVAWLRRGGRG
jgi:hypothetical protein